MWQRCKAVIAETQRVVLVLVVILLFSSGLPLFGSNSVLAASITNRSVTIGSAIPGNTTSYKFSFIPSTPGAGTIQSLKFQACTLAIGTCTAPHGLSFSSAVFGTMSGWTDNTGAGLFAADNTGAGGCTPSASVLCAKRTDATVDATSTAHVISFTGIVNQDVNALNCSGALNCTFFVRITTYSDNAYATAVDTGTVASSTTQTLTVSAIVEEQLNFCVGSTTADTATGVIASSCSTITGTSLNLGILNSAFISVSPVPVASTLGDNNNGLVELSTNASNGVTVNYDAVQQSGTNHKGGLRVAGVTCNAGTPNNDQCINSQGSTAGQFTAGAENFGMSVAGVDCQNISGYACVFSTGTFHLNPTANYNCNNQVVSGSGSTYTTDSGQIAGPSNCYYAWDETGTTEQVASANTAVGNEALILKFAATPNLITPTGSYTALADFVATPTY